MPMLADVNTSRPAIANGALERVLDAAGDRVGLVVVVEVVQEDRELVAAEPRERVALAQARFEAARRRHQQLVADQVAETVVDDLEAVQIEIEHGERCRPGRLMALVRAGGRVPSTNTARLQSPVSGSTKPTLRRRSCAIACSVVSVSDPAMRTGRRPSPRTATPRQRKRR